VTADTANHDTENGDGNNDRQQEEVETIFLRYENEQDEDGNIRDDEFSDDEASTEPVTKRRRASHSTSTSRIVPAQAVPVTVVGEDTTTRQDTRQGTRNDTRQEDWVTAQDVQDIVVEDVNTMPDEVREKRKKFNRNFQSAFSSLDYSENRTTGDLAEGDFVEVRDGSYRNHRGVVSNCANRGIHVILNVLPELDTLNITMEIKFKRTKLYKLDIAPVQSNSQV